MKRARKLVHCSLLNNKLWTCKNTLALWARNHKSWNNSP